MGVYINMEKPKDSCWECKAQYHSVCSLKREYIKFDGILDDCPLIEISDELVETWQDYIKKAEMIAKVKAVNVPKGE